MGLREGERDTIVLARSLDVRRGGFPRQLSKQVQGVGFVSSFAESSCQLQGA